MPEGFDILVVVSDDDLGRVLELRLAADGHRPVRVSDAADAVDRVRDRHVDRVLLDLGWPPSRGVALLERIRDVAGKPDMPAVGFVDLPVVELPPWTRRTHGLTLLQKPATSKTLDVALRAGAG